ncbi:FAD-binding protein [Gymnodinialimonas ulvae]|uniref:FAD-binding protein n=1 Tax=Gymnodinialimonas ulvae TaxID=3126504 RepID=UPI0030A35CC1
MSPANEAELAAMVADATDPLRIVGGGTRAIGAPAPGEVVSLAAMSGIELYEPGALTLLARAGTPLAEIEALLESEGQMLPFEPPHMGGLLGRDGTSTLGGVVATNAAGPRRLQAGACRDALIGVRFVDGSGTIVKNGGRVMKNVTGYDLVKLMAGSWGTLGVLSEVAFRVLPKLNGATLAVQSAGPSEAVDIMTKAMTSPFDVNGAGFVPGEAVYIRVEGLEASVAYRVGQLRDLIGGEIDVIDDPVASAKLWQRLRDVTDFAEGSAAVWRVSMKATDLLEQIEALEGAEYRLDWAGGLAWVRMVDGAAEADVVALHQALQAACLAKGGHATLMRARDAVLGQVPAFQPEAPGVARLSAGLRQKFDPRGVLNAGLMGA